MKTKQYQAITIKDKQLDALFKKVLPPEGFGEDSNVEELYNRIMDIESKLEAKDKEIAELKSKISNILAVFHADGGHYETAHGTDKALNDAVTKYYELHAAIEDERMKVAVLSKMNFNLAKADNTKQITELKAEIEKLKIK